MARSRVLASCDLGVYGDYWFDDDASDEFFAAGLRNLKDIVSNLMPDGP